MRRRVSELRIAILMGWYEIPAPEAIADAMIERFEYGTDRMAGIQTSPVAPFRNRVYFDYQAVRYTAPRDLP